MEKESCKVVVLGHVGTGKSTIVGYLLYKYSQKGTQRSTEIDALQLKQLLRNYEREQNICLREIKTEKTTYEFIDATGKSDFIKDMIVGMHQPDIALLCISAILGDFEAGICKLGNTRPHTQLACDIGVKHIVVAVTQMDVVKYSQERFDEIRKELSYYLKKLGQKPENISFVPLSGLCGDNLLEESPNMPWYNDATLIEVLDSIQPAHSKAIDKPLRICIQEVFDIAGVGTVAAGRVNSGELKKGMTISIAQLGMPSEVISIEKDSEKLEEAQPGDYVGFHISNLCAKDIRRGFVASDANNDPASACESFLAHIVVVGVISQIRDGYSPVVSCHTSNVPCRLELVTKIDRYFGKVLEGKPTSIKTGDSALVNLFPLKPMCVETFASHPALGRIVIRERGQPVVVGIIKAVVRKSAIKTKRATKR